MAKQELERSKRREPKSHAPHPVPQKENKVAAAETPAGAEKEWTSEHGRAADEPEASGGIGQKLQAIPGKLTEAKDNLAERARSASMKLSKAKDSLVERVSNTTQTLADIKDWTADKGRAVDDALEKAQAFVERAAQVLDEIKAWTSEKARKADETIELAKDAVARASDTIETVQNVVAEKAKIAEATLEKAYRVAARNTREDAQIGQSGAGRMENLEEASGRQLERLEKSPAHALDIRQKIARCQSEISELERKINMRSADLKHPAGGGGSDREVQPLLSRVAELKKQITEYEREIERLESGPATADKSSR